VSETKATSPMEKRRILSIRGELQHAQVALTCIVRHLESRALMYMRTHGSASSTPHSSSLSEPISAPASPRADASAADSTDRSSTFSYAADPDSAAESLDGGMPSATARLSLVLLAATAQLGSVMGINGGALSQTRWQTNACVQVSQAYLGESDEKSITISGVASAVHAAVAVIARQLCQAQASNPSRSFRHFNMYDSAAPSPSVGGYSQTPMSYVSVPAAQSVECHQLVMEIASISEMMQYVGMQSVQLSMQPLSAQSIALLHANAAQSQHMQYAYHAMHARLYALQQGGQQTHTQYEAPQQTPNLQDAEPQSAHSQSAQPQDADAQGAHSQPQEQKGETREQSEEQQRGQQESEQGCARQLHHSQSCELTPGA
jgi:hypothetical protein